MGDDGEPRCLHAPRRLRARRTARRRSDDHARDLPVGPRVVLYHAEGCHLCDQARAVLRDAGAQFEEVDITGNPELEASYREWLPVVEIDSERAFVYFVDPVALRKRLDRSSVDPTEAGG